MYAAVFTRLPTEGSCARPRSIEDNGGGKHRVKLSILLVQDKIPAGEYRRVSSFKRPSIGRDSAVGRSIELSHLFLHLGLNQLGRDLISLRVVRRVVRDRSLFGPVFLNDLKDAL
jgi:hypothetical protein